MKPRSQTSLTLSTSLKELLDPTTTNLFFARSHHKIDAAEANKL
jgi:hypothetical protein